MKKLIFAVTILAVSTAQAGNTVGVEHVGRSWYSSLGEFNPFSDNYFAGKVRGWEFRNFFVFDLSSIDLEIESMQLVVFNGVNGYAGSDPSETYTLFDVSTDPLALMNGTEGTAAFMDLGTGVSYGSHIATEADNGSFISIALNSSAVADANTSAGGLWALGGAITTLDTDPFTPDEGLFGASQNSPVTQLVLIFGPPCFDVIDEEIVCHDQSATFTYTVQGLSSCTGGVSTYSFTGSADAIGEEMCFTILVTDQGGGFCCSTQICVTIPDCTPVGNQNDLNGDGIVGMVDFLVLLALWGSCSDCGTCLADFDGDCAVGILDLLILLGSWG